MSNTVISIENLSKSYRLGQIGTGTLTNDLKVWWAKAQGKPNPMLKIGQVDHNNMDGETLWALKDVSFTVEQGEVLGIIGRNGAGKSTLLKILSRVTAPTSGCVKVKGRIASLLEVGTGFHPDLTGRENIYLNGAILGMNKQEIARKFDEIVAFAEIEKFIDTPVKRYSSGMYVRLAFAVAAHLESEILLVDEVLAVGDAEFQKKCLGKMGDVASKEGRTVLFVSHNMTSVMNLCKIGILLNQGKINFIGKVEDVIAQYNNSHNNFFTSNNNYHIDTNELDHSGSGEARIIWVEINNSKGEGTLSIQMNEEISFRLGIQNPHKFSLAYAIEIVDRNEYPLFHIWSGFEEIERSSRNDLNNLQIAQVTIPSLQLFPDYYYINAWIGNHTKRIDKVEKCIRIEVTKDYAIKQDLLTTRGRIYKTGKWEVINTDSHHSGENCE